MSKRVVVLGVAVIALAVVAVAAVGRSRAVSAQKPEEKREPAQQVCLLKVEGMTCTGCEAAVKNAAKNVVGVKDAKVSYATGTAEITYDPTKTTPESIAKAVTEKSGFRAQVP